MKKVNIVLATYNGEKYIKELLDSILNSTYKNFVINVCDDHSTDSTCDIIKEYVELYNDRVKLYQNENNLGSTSSFLSNLKRISVESPSEYYMFCDQDDIWLSDKIAVSVKAIGKIENRRGAYKPILVFTDAIIVDDNLNFINRSFYKTNRLKVQKTYFRRMLIENKCIGCTTIMNASLVNMLDKTNKDIRFHDWWMALIGSAFGIVKFNKTPTILYRQHEANQVGQTSYNSYFKKRASSKDDVKDRLLSTYKQAEYFYAVYKDRLPLRKRKQLEKFIKLESAGFFSKRIIILKYRFFKSGLLRNLGLLFYV